MFMCLKTDKSHAIDVCIQQALCMSWWGPARCGGTMEVVEAEAYPMAISELIGWVMDNLPTRP